MKFETISLKRMKLVNDFDGNRVQTAVYKNLQRIIYKAVFGNTGFTGKQRAGDTHPKMRAEAFGIGPHVPRMFGTFVDHVQHCGLKFVD